MNAQAAPATTVIRRAYRLTLDPTSRQAQTLSRWDNVARAMHNLAFEENGANHQPWLKKIAIARDDQCLPEEHDLVEPSGYGVPDASARG